MLFQWRTAHKAWAVEATRGCLQHHPQLHSPTPPHPPLLRGASAPFWDEGLRCSAGIKTGVENLQLARSQFWRYRLRVSLGTENPWNRIVSFFEGGRSELFKKTQSSTAIEFRKLRIFRWSCGASKRLKKQWRQHLQSLIIFGHFDGGTVSWHMLGLRIRHPKTWQVGIWRMFRCMWSLLYRNYQLPMPWSNGNCTCFTGHQNSCGMLRGIQMCENHSKQFSAEWNMGAILEEASTAHRV